MAENKSDPATPSSGPNEESGRRDVEEYLASQAWENRLAEARARREKVLAARHAAGGAEAVRPPLRPLSIPVDDARSKTLLVPPRQTEAPIGPDVAADPPPHRGLKRRASMGALLCGGVALAALGWFAFPAGDPEISAPAARSGADPSAPEPRSANGPDRAGDEPVGPSGPTASPDRAGGGAAQPAPRVQDRADGPAPIEGDEPLAGTATDLGTRLLTAGRPGKVGLSGGEAQAYAPLSSSAASSRLSLPGLRARSLPDQARFFAGRAASDIAFGAGIPRATLPSLSDVEGRRLAFGAPAGEGIPSLAAPLGRLAGPRGDGAQVSSGRVPARPGTLLALEGPASSGAPTEAFRAPSEGTNPQGGALPGPLAAPGGTTRPSALAPVAVPDTASYDLRIHAASDEAAGALQDSLTGAGFTTVDVRVAPFQWPETTIFYFHDADARAARGIADLLGGTATSAAGMTPSPPAGRIDVHLGG